MWDCQFLNGAIGDLQQPVVDASGALSNLENVALTWNGISFSYPVYLQELTRHDMSYYRINWGAQGKQVNYVDVMRSTGRSRPATTLTLLPTCCR